MLKYSYNSETYNFNISKFYHSFPKFTPPSYFIHTFTCMYGFIVSSARYPTTFLFHLTLGFRTYSLSLLIIHLTSLRGCSILQFECIRFLFTEI